MAFTQRIATTYEHVQETPSSTWVIQHYLHMYPVVDIFIDFEGEQHRILPLSVTYDNENQCTVAFTQPRAGLATVS